MRARHHSSAVNWPFWLLIAAWFCANIPSSATLHAFVWVKGAGHFSHHAVLRQNVADVLSGKTHQASHRAAAAESTRPSLPSALPSGGMLKKIDLSLTSAPLRLIAIPGAGVKRTGLNRAPADLVADVPYPPPRVRGQA